MTNKTLRDRLVKNSTIDQTSVLTESILFSEKDKVPTAVPIINVALGGSFDGGLMPGVTMLAGPSKHFKTAFGLLLTSSFLTKYADGIVLFYDSEFGTPESYFDSFKIPKESIVHTPITNIEELKHDLAVQLKDIKRGEHVLILIDSIGNVASIKEVTDAEDGKSVADMTRAKQLKSLFRIITPHLTLKNIPLVCINHTYKEIGMFPKDIVSGGTGSYYAGNDIWILGRQQDKEGEGAKAQLTGYNFVINIEKSRSVREKSKILVSVSFEHGIYKWSGLFDLALEAGMITKPTQGWYQIGGDGKKFTKAQLEENNEFWAAIIEDDQFKDFVEKKYKLANAAGMIT